MPGVLILEALAQAAAVLSFETMGTRPDADSIVYFAGIDEARFRRPVVPGDQLLLEVELLRNVARHLNVATARVVKRWRPRRSSCARSRAEMSAVDIHPSAIVAAGAERRGVKIGPYCVIGPHVKIGARESGALRARGAHGAGGGQPRLSFLLAGAGAAGHEVRGNPRV